MTVDPKDVAMALDLKRGQRSWRNLDREQYAKAMHILTNTSDARLSQLAESTRRPRQHLFIHAASLRRGR